ncbi:MAG: hypothetical protein ACF8TS_17760 [Maioricimonas sp. JB049]
MSLCLTRLCTDGRLQKELELEAGPAARPELIVLIIEYRDEIFSRLEHDLRQRDIGCYRAISAEEVLRIHSRIPVSLTLAGANLPETSIWLTTAKLRLYDPDAPIWLYIARPSRTERRDAKLAGLERLLGYDGSLVDLSDQVAPAVAASQYRLAVRRRETRINWT